MFKNHQVFEYSGEFEEFAELFLEGKVESGCWWTHLKEYLENSKNMDILFLRYEDLHSDGLGMIRKVNDFLDLPKISQEQV